MMSLSWIAIPHVVRCRLLRARRRHQHLRDQVGRSRIPPLGLSGMVPLRLPLGAGVMLAAIATVAWHREYRRAVPPFIVLVLLVVVGWTI